LPDKVTSVVIIVVCCARSLTVEPTNRHRAADVMRSVVRALSKISATLNQTGALHGPAFYTRVA